MTLVTTSRIGQAKPRRKAFRIALPPATANLAQDEEWCVVRSNGEWREIRLHDYDKLFSVPGLYEHLIYDILKCDSPAQVRKVLAAELRAGGTDARSLRVLDLGAGNGMVGEEFADMGAEFIVGADIIDAAAKAAERDRPEVYEDYHVLDMTQLEPAAERELRSCRFNCLTCVAALGFGDIPTEAFVNAYNLIEPGGWIAFNIKASFLDPGDATGFAHLVRSIMTNGTLEVRNTHRYRHRLQTSGDPIPYVVVVGNKRGDIRADVCNASLRPESEAT